MGRLERERRLIAEAAGDAVGRGDAAEFAKFAGALGGGIWRTALGVFCKRAAGAGDEGLRLLDRFATGGGGRMARGEEFLREFLREAWRVGNMEGTRWAVGKLRMARKRLACNLPELGEGASEDEAANLAGEWMPLAAGAWMAAAGAAMGREGKGGGGVRGMLAAARAADTGGRLKSELLCAKPSYVLQDSMAAWDALDRMKDMLGAVEGDWTRRLPFGCEDMPPLGLAMRERTGRLAMQAAKVMGHERMWELGEKHFLSSFHGVGSRDEFMGRVGLPRRVAEAASRLALARMVAEAWSGEVFDGFSLGMLEGMVAGGEALPLLPRLGFLSDGDADALRAESWGDWWASLREGQFHIDGPRGRAWGEMLAYVCGLTGQPPEEIPGWVGKSRDWTLAVETATLAAAARATNGVAKRRKL